MCAWGVSMETVSRGAEKQTKLEKISVGKWKQTTLVYALIVFIQIDGQKGDYLTYREEKNTGNPQAMSVPPHVTKQPHLVGKLVALRERTRVNKHRLVSHRRQLLQLLWKGALCLGVLARLYLAPVASRLLDAYVCKPKQFHRDS